MHLHGTTEAAFSNTDKWITSIHIDGLVKDVTPVR